MNRFRAAGYVMSGLLFLGILLLGCSDDESSLNRHHPVGATVPLVFANPMEIEVNPTLHQALLLHDRESTSGPSVQLVDLKNRRVLSTRLLLYYDVYDIMWLSSTEACLAGRPQGNAGYALQFLHLPDLAVGTRVITHPDTSGEHGYLAFDSAQGVIYYSHAGSGLQDVVYAVSAQDKVLLDADNDFAQPFGFDNELVGGLFSHPGRIFVDAAQRKLVVGNLGDDYITVLDASLWGTLHRGDNLQFPISGTEHISTAGGLAQVRPQAMAYGAGVYVFCGTSGSVSFMSGFDLNSAGLYFVETMAGLSWRFHNADIHVHPRDDVLSVFVLQEDSSGTAVGQYRLNNFHQVAESPHRCRVIPDSLISAVGLDTGSDWIIVGDAVTPRLELLDIP